MRDSRGDWEGLEHFKRIKDKKKVILFSNIVINLLSETLFGKLLVEAGDVLVNSTLLIFMFSALHLQKTLKEFQAINPFRSMFLFLI